MAAEKSQSKTKSKAAGKKSADAAADAQPSFEEALEALEALVAEMEGDDLPLEKMIVGYQEGVRLRGICEKRLEEAQAKVELIRDRGAAGDDAGEAATLEDFDPAGTDGAAAGSSGPRKSSADAADVKGGTDGELF